MKTTLRIAATAALMLCMAGPAQAQRLLTTTTLSANVAVADNVIQVTSSTGFTVGQLVFVDWEVMRIDSLNGVAGTSTLINVARGRDGTARRAHDNATVVIVSLINTDFHNTDPDWGADCVRGTGQAAILPWINTTTGDISNCATSGTAAWTITNVAPKTYGSLPSAF